MLSSKTVNEKALLALAWVAFFWGTTWLASKEGMKDVPAIQLCAIRQLLASCLYLGYFIFKKEPWPKGKQWLTILMLSLLNFMLSNYLSTWGVQYIPSGLGAIIAAIFPLWLVIIAFIGGERLPIKALAGILMGFGGVCIIFYDHLKDFLNADFSFGIIISIASTLTWAFGAIYTKKHSTKFNPYFSLGLQMFISSMVLFNVAYASGDVISIAAISAKSWWAISYLVLIGSVFTFVAYIYCLKHLPTSLASIYAYVNPVVAVLLGALILNERLNMYVAMGGAVTITGVYIVNNSFRKKTT